MNPQVLSEESRASVQNHSWKTSREKVGKLGSAVVSIPDTSEGNPFTPHDNNGARRLATTDHANQVDFQNDLLSALATNKDLYLTSTLLEQKRCTREAIALHAFNHVTKYVTKYYMMKGSYFLLPT
jgi:U3 small nucleolar RNA-associated protein 25